MKKKFSSKPKTHSIWLSMVFGALTAILISVAGAIVGTALINGGKVSETAYPAISAIIWCLSSFVGTLVASKTAGQQALLVSGTATAAYMLILTAVQILFFDSQFNEIWKGILICIAGIIPTLLICGKSGGQKKSKIRYRRA